MPYTIKIHDTIKKAEIARNFLFKRMQKDGRFTAELGCVQEMFVRGITGPKEGSRKPGFGFTVTRVRLTQKKEYCGQHAGPCLVNPLFGSRKKMKATYLEWDDWVAFHGLVNDVLDELKANADVWSKPMETTHRMWMRRGLVRRIHYDYTEKHTPGHWAPLYLWNHGTPDQFG